MNAERSFRCFAKVNLQLSVGPRRDDGFHDIDTIFQTIDLHDILTISPAKDFGFTCNDASLPTGDENLVVRAVWLFAERTGIEPKCSIHLEKRIPVAAGLGGGSSDAAATLRALNMLQGAPLDMNELHELSLALGSDVPFFLIGGRARGRGRGEVLEQLPEQPTANMLIVKPPFGVSAREAYHYFDLTSGAQFRDTSKSGLFATVSPNADIPWHNDLERGVFATYPAIRQIKEVMLEQGALDAVMCGSGSAVVAQFSDEAAARKTTQVFRTGEQNVILTKSLSSEQFVGDFTIGMN